MAQRSTPLKDHWKEQRLFLSRVVAAAVLVLALSGLLIGRLIQLQVIDYQRFSRLSQDNRLRIEPLAPTRGLIFDRNGLVVAENLPIWQLVVVPEQIADLDQTLQALEELELVEPSERELLTDLVRSHRRFERVKLRDLTEEQASRFAVRRHRFPGVDIQEGLARYYPFREAGAHTVGYVGSVSTTDLERIDRSNYAATSQIGKTGVERSFEDVLHGSVGYRQQVVNAQGRVLLDPANEGAGGESASTALETRWPIPGDNIVLALDMRVQLAAQEALAGLRGAVVAIDPRTGDVLSLVSTPSFDPNQFTGGLSRQNFVAMNNDAAKPLFNRALAGTYPPGSTLKPFVALGGLRHEATAVGTKEYCPGFFTLPGSSHRYRDWKPQGHGHMDMHQAIVESCDVYFYRLAMGLGIDHLAAFLQAFGFGEPTGIDILGERRGVVPSREWKRQQFTRREDQVWFPGETVITGIGQGFTTVTPLQLAHASATLAARGVRLAPRLVLGVEGGSTGAMEWFEPKALPGPADIAPEHWEQVHAALVGVTTEPRGTARAAMQGSAHTVAGKTGTAQVFTIAQEEKYDETKIDETLRDHGLFFAYAPAEDPQIVVAVVVENGGGGSRAAAPVARRVLDAYFRGDAYVARNP
jgi:penicillin-binding protein 2